MKILEGLVATLNTDTTPHETRKHGSTCKIAPVEKLRYEEITINIKRPRLLNTPVTHKGHNWPTTAFKSELFETLSKDT